MKNRYRWIALFCVAALCGCQKEGGTEIDPGDGHGEPISFSIRTDYEYEINSKAAAGFPNNGRIGVIAAEYNNPVDWYSYPDIDDAGATATSATNGLYSFTWDTGQIKYWPFDNSQLVFMAYSPKVSENTSTMSLSSDRTTINLTLIPAMPDVMFASANATAATTPYRMNPKPSAPVDLGTFMHALSQLTVKVVADPSMNPKVKLTSLKVHSTRTSATLSLPDGASGLTVSNTAGNYTKTLVNGTTNITTAGSSYTSLLLPGTEDYITVEITLADQNLTYQQTYAISDFENSADPLADIILEMGKKTELTITVKGVKVEQPTTQIHLLGTLLDWDPIGDLGVTIY